MPNGGINGPSDHLRRVRNRLRHRTWRECYERLKGKHGGATVFQPLSTGITFALTEKAPGDKIPLITAGYGRSESQDGTVFKWNFPLAGTYWLAADALVQTIGKKEGGMEKLKGKKVTLVSFSAGYGKEPIPPVAGARRAAGFNLQLLPVTAPAKRKAPGCRCARPCLTMCCCVGLGVMNSTASRKPRPPVTHAREDVRRVVVGCRPDVEDVGERKG
ncbi:ABC transporter substrate-binding protein [Candidatus Skiveiella danica]|uniref:ABC transporter substrate-binding protein n=1 Tax=Candidatus Skiveiella danica TaxID=3386177 RepID=UPI0039B8FAAD